MKPTKSTTLNGVRIHALKSNQHYGVREFLGFSQDDRVCAMCCLQNTPHCGREGELDCHSPVEAVWVTETDYAAALLTS